MLICSSKQSNQGLEFITEKKKVNTHASTQKRTRSRKHVLVQEGVHAKKELGQENTHENTSACLRGRVRVFLPEFFAWTLSCMSACLHVRVRVFLIEFFFAWTHACLLSCSLSFFLL